MLQELIRVLPPPRNPIDTGPFEAWLRIEKEIGTPLPDDYKSFVERYGSGGIDQWLYLFNPFAASRYTNLQSQISVRLGALRQLRHEYDVQVPFPIFPEANGVLPWACTGNADVLYWLTQGEPSGWTICVNESRGPDWEQYTESMTGFLAKLIRGEIKVAIFPDDVFNRKEARFIPQP